MGSGLGIYKTLGRGTRIWTDPVSGEKKADFLVIDHWDNFDYFQVNRDGRQPAVSEPLPARLFRLRLEKHQILAGRGDTTSATYTIRQLRDLTGTLPLENVNVAPHAEEIRRLCDSDAPWTALDDARAAHLSHTIAPLLRFSSAGSYVELQFENQTEQIALAHLRADAGEVQRLRGAITESLALLPVSIPELRPHLEALAAVQSHAFWEHLTLPAIMQLQETFAPLMRFRNRRPAGTFVSLAVPDEIQRRHWIVFGPSGEGAFAENYRTRAEAIIRDLAGENPALQRLQRGEPLSDDDLASLAAVLSSPDLFITEERLREAFQQPAATLPDFLRHILTSASLPSREETISQAFDEWVRQHPHFTATQLMFIRTLRQAVMQRAEITTVESLRQPPFTAIGDPEQLFATPELVDLLNLLHRIAA